MINIAKKLLIKLIYLLLHLGAVGVILFAFWDIALWYLKSRPIWGVDFHLLPSLVSLLGQNFVAPQAFWIYSWFAGWPMTAYPNLHVYLTYLLSNFFDLIYAAQLLMISSTVVFILGAYTLFYILSRNFLLSTILAVATAYSSGVYQTLTWAGSLPSYATQAALPWTVAFFVLYLNSGNLRFLAASILVAGVSIWGHPLIFIIYILPATVLLIVFNFRHGLAFFDKLKQLFVFLTIPVIIALPILYPTFETSIQNAFKSSYTQKALSTTTVSSQDIDIGAKTFNKLQPERLYSDNHPAPFYFLGFISGVFLISLILGRKFKTLLNVLPFLLIVAYFIFYIWLFGQGISIYHGGWYRLFWSIPIWIGALAAVLFKASIDNFFNVVKTTYLRIVLYVGSSLAILVTGVIIFTGYFKGDAIWRIIYRSQISSAYPDILNIVTSTEGRAELKPILSPKWLNADDTNWRIYSPDQTVNLVWNSLYKMPLARGYLDPNNLQKGYVFWLDAALSENEDSEPQLVDSFGYPPETALSNAQFLIDWNAIRFYEGGHTSEGPNPPVPAYLREMISQEETLDLDFLKYTDRHRTMRYFEFKEEYVSPILSVTNAPSLAIFASDVGYETVIRTIAERDNLNSQKLIPLKLGRKIDDYDLSTLKKFEAIYLYDYDFAKSDRAFRRLTDYVKSGGKLFIETGVEVKNSSGELPELFPIKRVERKGFGRQWSLAGDGMLAKDLDLAKFAPPIFNEDEWKLSAADSQDLRPGATVILKNKGKIIMASQTLGDGQVVWSGMNLAYHLSRYHNEEEAKLLINILASIVDLSVRPEVETDQVEFKNPNFRTIKIEQGRGILFKEQAYPGWVAKMVESQSGKRGNLPMFAAGPASPGYMYIPLPEGAKTVELRFLGSGGDKIMVFISFLTVLLLLDYLILKGLILGSFVKRVVKIVGKWWEKEEE